MSKFIKKKSRQPCLFSFQIETETKKFFYWYLVISICFFSHRPAPAPCVQLNLHKTDLLFRYLSHHLTWHCSSIYEDLHRFTQICPYMIIKLFLLLFLNSFRPSTLTKTILRSDAANFLQICANLQKYWNNAMSNYGLSIEIIDQSHGD